MSEINSPTGETEPKSIVDKLVVFELTHRAFLNVVFKPLLTIMIFLAMGYYTMWLSTNYVKADKFTTYVEKQIQSDKAQDEILKSRFEITQTKLETIINQQTAYAEQLKAYNQVLSNFQKQVDSIDNRIVYLERRNFSKQ